MCGDRSEVKIRWYCLEAMLLRTNGGAIMVVFFYGGAIRKIAWKFLLQNGVSGHLIESRFNAIK